METLDTQIAAGFVGVTKVFGATRALKGIDLEIRQGEIHALVGENGAGKSTALGILAGRIGPTSGIVEVFGEQIKHADPRAARAAGVIAIYQELTMVPALSVEANVFLGQPQSHLGVLSERGMRKRYLELCDRVGVAAHPPGTLAGSLSVGDQQLLEIMRALVSDPRVILFDEPTASLGQPERVALLELLRSLRADGITIVFVSHNLDEVLDVSDQITVFRDGALQETRDRAGWDNQQLVSAMLGENANLSVLSEMIDPSAQAGPERHSHATGRAIGEVLVKVEGLTVPGGIADIDVEIRADEILGVGGLVGSGRTTLLRALAGLEPRAEGRMWVKGAEVPWPHSVRRARALGIALVPEDRKGQGLVLSLTAMENVVLSDMGSIARFGVLSPKAVRLAAAKVCGDFGFSPERLGATTSQLSGGNQQKLLLARWKHWTPTVLLADEPTRGIDIGAKDEIVRSLEAMARRGVGIVMVSSELEEVAAVSDRVIVLSEGRAVGLLLRTEGNITVSEILHAAFHVGDQQ
jgi:ABC-type sugar transport system ATPase subunit